MRLKRLDQQNNNVKEITASLIASSFLGVFPQYPVDECAASFSQTGAETSFMEEKAENGSKLKPLKQ